MIHYYTFPNKEQLPYSPYIFRLVEILQDYSKYKNSLGYIVLDQKAINLQLSEDNPDNIQLHNILATLVKLPTGIKKVNVCNEMSYDYTTGRAIPACGRTDEAEIHSGLFEGKERTCDRLVVDFDEQALLNFTYKYLAFGRKRRRQIQKEKQAGFTYANEHSNAGTLIFHENGKSTYITPSGKTREDTFKQGTNAYLLLNYLVHRPKFLFNQIELNKILNMPRAGANSTDERRVRDTIQEIRGKFGINIEENKDDDLFNVQGKRFGLKCSIVYES